VALAVFGAIILSHYLVWGGYWDYSEGKGREVTKWTRLKTEGNVTGRQETKAPPGTTMKDGYMQYPTTRRYPIGDWHSRLEWVSPEKSMLPDVRMPLFVLGVVYAGLVAILGDNKRKEQ
jgi:hypothetical protein